MMTFPDWVYETKTRLGPWLAQLMEPEPPFGRFRHAPKALVGPNLLSSAYAVNSVLYRRLLVMSAPQRQQWCEMFQAMQDEQTGQFIDPVLESHLPKGSSAHGRDALWNHRRYVTKMGCGAILQLGGQPRYRIPMEKIGFDPATESIENHLASYDWNTNPWGAGSAAAGAVGLLDSAVRSGRHEFIPTIHNAIVWLEQQQDDQTGLWGNNACPLHVRVNSAMKVITRLYNTFRRPLHYPDKIINSVLDNWANVNLFSAASPDLSACDEMNTLYVATVALRFSQHRRQEVTDAAYAKIEKLKMYLRSDGGFSLVPSGSIRDLTGIPMTRGEDQGDIHGLSLICNSLTLIAHILGQADSLGWKYPGFHYGDWITGEGEYEPTWDVVDYTTYRRSTNNIEPCEECSDAFRLLR